MPTPHSPLPQEFAAPPSDAAVPWHRRYPDWVAGADEWQALFADRAPDDPTALLPLFRKRQANRGRRVRLFISHRQNSDDTTLARDLAECAKLAGMPVWIDVLDPTLNRIGTHAAAINGRQRAIAIAAAIEMALLNCTHAVALLTKHWRGSMWIPYEYGRIKLGALAGNVASYLTQDVPASDVPEYAELTRQLRSQQAFATWAAAAATPAVRPCL